jgi:hypothetical protein
MIASCESCGEDFLTESDPHVVRPTKNGYKLYCYCHIKGFDEVKSLTDKLTTQLVSYEATLGFLKDTLREIADEDYRGNRSSASVKAYQALKKIGAYKDEQI